MFQNLRQSTQIYILHKGASPYIETGSVVSVSAPRAKYPPLAGQLPQLPSMEMVVDLTVSVKGQNISFQSLPATAEIADSFQGGDVVITASRDAINAEVTAMKGRSEEIIRSIDSHKGIVDACDKMLATLNPEYAERQKQQMEIADMRSQIGALNTSLAELMETNRQLIERLGASGTPARKKNT